ncbi:prephenate dehydratase [Microlunatus soli]|uniref:Prephenate dehydratase n=1 Tax=Microlunatus soli TaxID=630515 RepID=A0A1H1TIJ2_9ACTN|nr:prephenate dehydratase [Microlunatus soli]SDS60032.1 prephenate dehydratase [Microlunatus soli]
MSRFGYFGPEGTFTHQALLTVPGADLAELTPYATVAGCLDGIRSGEVDAGLVPIENSVEGGVSATLDNLTYGEPLMITREVLLEVQFTLFVRPGTALTDVRRVLTHPHAAAQCRDWLAAHLPQADITTDGSTAAAAAAVADPDSGYDAAVCSRIAGELHGLEALADGIADNTAAVTRFILVTRPGRVGPATGADKTSLVLFMRADHSGALLELLEQFASRGVNLCRIESRPTKTQLGSYCFAIDAEGHVDDARMAEALMGLHRVSARVIFLGSFPRADSGQPDILAGTANADYAAAQQWLDRLRNPSS